MKKYLFFAASAALLMACSEKPGYDITGTVSDSNLNGKYVYLYTYGSNDAAPLDSALVQNGTFTLKGTQETPALRTLRFAEDVVEPVRANTGENAPFSATFILENGKLQATLGPSSSVKGTPENDALTTLQDKMKATRQDWDKLIKDIKSEDKEVAEAAGKKLDEIDAAVTSFVKSYITDNNNKQSAAKLFYDFRYNLTEDEQNDIIAQADSVFKTVPGINAMIDHLNILKNVAVGKQFTDFEMADAKGQMHKLSEYVGNGKNVVLIDFWASWCPPCRREMPNLVNAYKQYKNKGFEIIGISLDSNADAWAKGVKDLNITWPQLSDLQGWKNAGAALYGVNSIPHTVLVDKDGTIIAKNLHGDELNTKLKEVVK
ncbi:TlpA disulfide reductase family protein [Parabacteroides provencensis]|uniref:TlpA disulfide reductase family protein n=1 Tax=Parabacteroides provencensis TaxID=1944636 RepID=UPI000C157AF3|nr:TlpA disulfide reductase family protein [Parabacteroides provencensis]